VIFFSAATSLSTLQSATDLSRRSRTKTDVTVGTAQKQGRRGEVLPISGANNLHSSFFIQLIRSYRIKVFVARAKRVKQVIGVIEPQQKPR